MNPGALPPALSDLFLPEAKADPTAPAGSTSTDADVDRFERYLLSARTSVGADQALPVPARSDDRRATRPEPGPNPVEPPTANDRQTVTHDDRRPVDDGRDRRDQVDDRRTTDRTDDGAAPVDETGGNESSERTNDAETDSNAPTDEAASTDDEGTEAETGERRPDDGSPGATPDPVAIETALDLTVALDGQAARAEAGTEAVAPTVEAAPSETVAVDGSDEVELTEQEAAPAVLGSQLERAADPALAAAAAAVGADTDADGPAPSDIELTDGGGDEADLEISLDRADGSETGDLADGDLVIDTAGDGAEADGDTRADGDPNDQVATTGDQEQGAADTAVDGPDLAPITGPASAQAARATTGATTGPTTGVEAVGAAAPARTRATTATTAPAPSAEGPVVDGDPADPLWLQVRRAIGSLRNLQNGEQQLTIRLRPVELGSIVVRVNAGDNGTTVSLLADSAVAATQLTQQRQQLISELEQGGLAGVTVDVGTEDNPDRPEGGATDEGDGGDGATADGTAAAAAMAGAGASGPNRTGGRGRRTGSSSGGLVDVEL